MGKLCTWLLAASPFLALYAWAGWWFATDTLRERRQARAAAQESQAGHLKQCHAWQPVRSRPHSERVRVVFHSGLPK
jgi:hypothetical protein